MAFMTLRSYRDIALYSFRDIALFLVRFLDSSLIVLSYKLAILLEYIQFP